ncbi:glycoside hydrolase family 3 N-terminal domain-containing protein [Borrelia sp. P9F1]|uniref:glycoside hydrolase family 3 N-terminal domain-containing protein n=1 Tax=Borrelia sp. P9F1 TaxID=3058374 RepID=UPI002648CE24|nr:glycoside hydrolase family 3 N-terminal domain-containing protein [Borrelia sp. P9F1]WKC57603.1 glycoside hydrolase family 3 N-terminal domain-containing protein [Borrelia sp. P9F1]
MRNGIFKFLLIKILFSLNFYFLGAVPEIDYDYFEQDKSDLVSIDRFLGKVDFKDLLRKRCLFIGIRNVSKPSAVQTLSRDALKKIKKINPIGIILFRENFKDAKQTKELIDSLKQHIGSDIFIAVDEEGGLVNRVSKNKKMGVYNFPSMESVGRTNDVHLAYKIGEILGKQLRRLGINVNMAPVADSKPDSDSPLVNRTFGHLTYNIGLMVESFVEALQRQGVSAVIKHFPGLGGTKVDTHKEIALLPYSKNFFMKNNFVPFIFGKEAKFIMIGHVLAPKISKDVTSMSRDIVKIVRYNLNIDSIIITDAYDMGAIVNNFKIESAIRRSLNSGVDVILIPELNK